MASKLSKRKQPRREDKILKEHTKISGKVFDDKTMLTLYYFLSNKKITSLEFPISQGKESVVFYAKKRVEKKDSKGNAKLLREEEIAVKIFKYETASFQKRMEYIEGDKRFKVQHNLRAMVDLFAKKEFLNLKKCFDAGISVPKPLALRRNVILMRFIGEKGMPAPLLAQIPKLPEKERYFAEVIDLMKKMYKINLVHSDLSEFNIIIWEGRPIVLDVSQAVLSDHPKAGEFLKNDVHNVCSYFIRIGLQVDPQQVLSEILAAKTQKGQN